jgi:hypothetical protein
MDREKKITDATAKEESFFKELLDSLDGRNPTTFRLSEYIVHHFEGSK